MTDKERDRIECAIRHIQTAVDVDSWAAEIAVEAMRKLFGNSEQLESDHVADTGKMVCGLIRRQAVLDAIKKLEKSAPTAQHLSAIFDCEDIITALPPAQSELVRKIYAIGNTGKEGRIYIGGRLFTVKELAQ